MPRPRKDGSPAAPANKKRLTDLYVHNVKPKDKPFVVWDTKQRGLALRVTPSGAKRWKVVYSISGRPRWYSIGKVGLADARKLANRIMLRVAEGGDPHGDRMADRDRGTFGELYESYLNEDAKLNNKSWKQADRLVRRYVLPKWGRLDAASIKKADVKALRRKIAAPILANQVMASASAVFSFGVEEDVPRHQPLPRHRQESEKELRAHPRRS